MTDDNVIRIEGREPEREGDCGWTQPGAPCFDSVTGEFFPDGKP